MEHKKTPLFTGVNSVFKLAGLEKSLLVNYRGFDWNQIVSELKELYNILKPVRYDHA